MLTSQCAYFVYRIVPQGVTHPLGDVWVHPHHTVRLLLLCEGRSHEAPSDRPIEEDMRLIEQWKAEVRHAAVGETLLRARDPPISDWAPPSQVLTRVYDLTVVEIVQEKVPDPIFLIINPSV